MPSQRIRLKQVDELPINWLGEGKLKLSLILRHSPATSERSEAFSKLLLEETLPRGFLAEFAELEANGSILEKASKDYLRCILSKSVANVYRNATARYRNEAARKQSFTRLLEIFEGCHLAESVDPESKLRSIPEGDRVGLWIKSTFERFLNERIDLGPEHAASLVTARTEFRKYLKLLEEITGCSWQESDRFTKSLSVNSMFPSVVDESEKIWVWGSQWYTDLGVLNVNPPMLFLDTVRRGILIREAATLLSPRIFDRMPEAPRPLCEQSEYLAYKLMERKNEKELWSQARHGLRRATRVASNDLIDFFQDYEMMVGESLYKELWLRLREFGEARTSFADYRIILHNLASRPVRLKFNPAEIRLLNLLGKRPDIKAGEAARALRLSIPTVMAEIRDLSHKAGLRFTIIVDMRRLGLVEHLLLLKTNRFEELQRTLLRFPFCRQVFRTYGSSDLFCVLDVPEAHTPFARAFVDDMKTRQLITDFKLLELERDFQAVNFGRYDSEDGRWNVHWDSWGIGLREALSKKTDVIAPSDPPQPYALDKLDLRILNALQNDCRMPYATMGRTLGVSGAYIGRKVERMVREHVFRYALWPMKIQAEDWGIVSLSCDRAVASVLAHYLSELPAWRGGLVTGDFGGLFAMVWAPSGEMRQFFKAIDDRLLRNGNAKAQSLDAVGEWILGRWLPVQDPYPRDLVDEKGEWIFDEAKYRSLVN